MNINFKYYIVTIGSIFLALGIGILIGSNLGLNGSISEQNTAIIDDIDKQFSQLKEKDDKLVSENEVYKKNIDGIKRYFSANESLLLSDKLKEKKIAIFSFGDASGAEKITSSIEQASGGIGFNIKISDSISSEDSIKKINERLKTNMTKVDEVLALISDSVKKSNSDGNLTALSDLGFINLIGFNSKYEDIDSIVIVTGFSSKVKNRETTIEKPFIDSVKGDKRLVAVEASGSSSVNLKSYSKNKIPTVNNIGDAIGRISTILILSDENIAGKYGNIEKDTLLLPNIN